MLYIYVLLLLLLLLLGSQLRDLPKVTELSKSRGRIPARVFLTPGLLVGTIMPYCRKCRGVCTQHKALRQDLKFLEYAQLAGQIHMATRSQGGILTWM